MRRLLAVILARLEENVTTLADSQFRIVPGLAGRGSVSSESVNYPGRYLRHVDYLLRLEAAADAPARGDATFHLE